MKHKGFTFVEVLVVLAIIGLLSTIAVVTLRPMTGKVKDNRRLKDVDNIRAALNLYKQETGFYPPSLPVGQPLVGPSGQVYLDQVPANTSDNSCQSEYTYTQKNNGFAYDLRYCLTTKVDTFNPGNCLATPGSLCCQSSCSGKCGGDDGCGSTCANTCGGATPYCDKSTNICLASRPTPCSSLASAANECNSSSAYGSVCGGGYLVCKAGDLSCGNINLVAAPSGCYGGTGDIATVCNSCQADSEAGLVAYNNFVSVGASDVVYGLNNFSDGADGTAVKNNIAGNWAAKRCLDLSLTINGVTYDDWYLPAAKELAAIIKSSDLFFNATSKSSSTAEYNENTTSATLQNSAPGYNTNPLISSTDDARVVGLYSVQFYRSSTESDVSKAWGQMVSGAQSKVSKGISTSVRCVRRF